MPFDDPNLPQMDKRVNESFLAANEHKILRILAVRLPAWVTPDQLTGLGVAGACIVMVGYVLSHLSATWLWLANFGLVVHWFGDSLDGTIARIRKIERKRYGFYLDQVIDTLGNLTIGLGIGLSPFVRMDLALLVLAIFHMLSIQVYVRAIVDREFHVAVGRLGPTEMRLGIITLNIGIMLFGAKPIPAFPWSVNWIDILMLATAALLLVILLYQMTGHLRRLGREDPGIRPPDAPARE